MNLSRSIFAGRFFIFIVNNKLQAKLNFLTRAVCQLVVYHDAASFGVLSLFVLYVCLEEHWFGSALIICRSVLCFLFQKMQLWMSGCASIPQVSLGSGLNHCNCCMGACSYCTSLWFMLTGLNSLKLKTGFCLNESVSASKLL